MYGHLTRVLAKVPPASKKRRLYISSDTYTSFYWFDKPLPPQPAEETEPLVGSQSQEGTGQIHGSFIANIIYPDITEDDPRLSRRATTFQVPAIKLGFGGSDHKDANGQRNRDILSLKWRQDCEEALMAIMSATEREWYKCSA
ncbi:hypothetical protein HGRIS_008705 [Hohenbuehelia grisea]